MQTYISIENDKKMKKKWFTKKKKYFLNIILDTALNTILNNLKKKKTNI